MVRLTGPVAVIRDGADLLQLFAVGDDGALYTVGQTQPNNGWSGWSSLGRPAPALTGPVAAGPVNLIDTIGRAVHALAADGSLYHLVQVNSGDPWGAWTPDGLAAVDAPALVLGWGLIDSEFAVGPDTVLHELSTGTAVPHPGPSLISRPAVGPSADGRLELFAVGTDDALWHQWQTAVGGGWSGWYSHGFPPSATLYYPPTTAPSADGRLETLALGVDTALHHIWQTAANNGWSPWYSHGSPPGMPPGPGLPAGPALAPAADGRLELFITGTEGALYHKWQTAPSNGWSGWYSHGLPPGVPPDQGLHAPPAVAASADGRLEVFLVTTDGTLWHKWQTAVNNGWSGWYFHGAP